MRLYSIVSLLLPFAVLGAGVDNTVENLQNEGVEALEKTFAKAHASNQAKLSKLRGLTSYQAGKPKRALKDTSHSKDGEETAPPKPKLYNYTTYVQKKEDELVTEKCFFGGCYLQHLYYGYP